MVYVCAAVTIEDGVMVSAGTVFTNDRFPRAATPDLRHLRPSDPDEHTLPTLVREGATLGANCTIGNDLVIGRFAMIGMGSVVTRSVPDFHLALGHPAAPVGCVCRCGQLLVYFERPGFEGPGFEEPGFEAEGFRETTCQACGRGYAVKKGEVREDS
jgi:hypothetical protein